MCGIRFVALSRRRPRDRHDRVGENHGEATLLAVTGEGLVAI
jgi:hypothetical protein